MSEPSRVDPPPSADRVLTFGVVAFVLALLYALAADPYHFVYDDGGITLRYAERLAHGSLGYVDGERVNGASSPLHTLALALGLRLGLDAEWAVRGIAALAFAGAIGLAGATFARRGAYGAAALALCLAFAHARPFEMLTSGLEVPFVWLSAAALFAALDRGGQFPIAIALALCAVNKLDGLLAWAAFVVVDAVRQRRIPFATLGIAGLVTVPLLLVVALVFGSVLPNSLLVKLQHGAAQTQFDPLWMPRLLWEGSRLACIVALGSVPLLFVHPPARRASLLAAQVWLVLHVSAHVFVRAGAPFPWYAAVPQAAVWWIAVETVQGFADLATSRLRRPIFAQLLPSLAAVATLGLKAPELLQRLERPDGPAGVPLDGAGDLARAAAGAWLRANTSGTELLSTPYGLPAFEYVGPVIDGSGLNSRRDPEVEARAPYELVGPLETDDLAGRGTGERRFVAIFRYDARAPIYAVTARASSEVVRANLAHVPPDFTIPPEIDPDGWLARARKVPISADELHVTCRRWRDRLARVEAGAMPDGATAR